MKLPRILITAMRSGAGKTMLTCGILKAMKMQEINPASFKCGPDYIDPMFHHAVLGVPSHNLDLFFSTPQTVRRLYTSGAAGHGSAVCEGAMGYYDGLGGVSAAASAWHTADVLDLPVLLVVQPGGASVTLAAEIQGLVHFRKNSHISGILLNSCSEKLYKMLKDLLERETGLPVLGYLPNLPQAAVESRHLGLKTAGEITDIQEKIALLADRLVMDWEKLAAVTERPCPEGGRLSPRGTVSASVRIAVARDGAFCFTYAETLEALQEKGAELCFFSPLEDTALPPNIGGLYLPGGYPELYAAQLAANTAMRSAVKTAVESGLPTVAECGGFLYLGQTLEDADGKTYPMAGVLPGQGVKIGRLVRFGYAALTSNADSMLFAAGETLPIHEFHHWDSTANGTDFTTVKTNGRSWACGFANAHLYAGFPHLYWAGTPLPQRFVTAACRYIKEEP